MERKIEFCLVVLSVLCINSSVFSIPTLTKIPSNKDWTSTGYTVNVGDKIEISAAGEISPIGEVKCNPNGVTDRPDLQEKNCVIKTSNHACLIGKIGINGTPFYVGSNLILVAESEGELFLGVNDTDLSNNSGEFSATIFITSVKSEASN